MPGPQVQLAVFFVEIEERGADDLGLDWLFGQPRTNNPVPVTQFLTNAPGSDTALQGDRLRVERLGRSSVTYQLGVFRAGGDEAAAQGRFVHVYVTRADQRPVAIPEAVLRVLEGLRVG
jgi:hypothetical protein